MFYFWRLDDVVEGDYYGFVLVLTRHMGSHTPSSEFFSLHFWRLGAIMQGDYCHFWRLDGVRQRDYYGFVLVLTRHMGSHTPTSEGLFPFVRGRWCYARKLWWLENLSFATRG